MIQVQALKKDYSLGKTTVKALQGINLEIQTGEFTSIVGPSGSGKSTLLNIIGLLDTPTSGEVLIDGQSTSGSSQSQLAQWRGKKIGFIFQSFNLIPVLNVYDNVLMSLALSKSQFQPAEAREAILKVIEEVGLTRFLRHKPAELSGGQRQRVAIARALVKRPEIIIADEPTANLDSQTTFEIVELMRRLNQEEKTTFLFSTHDERLVKFLDRTIRLEDGRIRATA